MKIKVNGKEVILSQGSVSVAELLKINKIEQPEMVSVQLNGDFVNTADLASTQVKEGDEVDFLYFMGGGRR